MTEQCTVCGNEFVRQTGRGRNPKQQSTEYSQTCSYGCMIIEKRRNYKTQKEKSVSHE